MAISFEQNWQAKSIRFGIFRRFTHFLRKKFRALSLAYQHWRSFKTVPHTTQELRVLYFCPFGKAGLPLIEKIIAQFSSYPYIDFLLVAYDECDHSKLKSDRVTIVSESKLKWCLAKKHLDPKWLKEKGYTTVFVWDDDLDVVDFSLEEYLQVFREKKFQMAQPALSLDSYYSHKITLKKTGTGRYTDFVEIMAPTFSLEAWEKFYSILQADWNGWGYGYDEYAKSLCKFDRMGIIDSQTVRHSRPIGPSIRAQDDYLRFKELHSVNNKSYHVNYWNF